MGERLLVISTSASVLTPPCPLLPQIGQSTTYVQLNKLCILTDPIFSTKTLDSWLAPRRLARVPCELAQLRRVDVVLVSHKWVPLRVRVWAGRS